MKLEIIGHVHSPYKQKFAIPRQPNLVTEAKGIVRFEPEFADPNSLRELEQFSHLWLIFLFNETAGQGWSPTVQPPRLGGKERVGVFASRSPFRPNPIGISAVKNLGHELRDGILELRVGGLDLLDGTPIIDIKPYVPYADSIPEAQGGFADEAPQSEREVVFSAEAERQLDEIGSQYKGLKSLIESVLRQDPRPAWRVKEQDDKRYGMHLYDLNIKWQISGDRVEVLSIEQIAIETDF